MLWKRCLIILFVLLQPLRGFAEAQAVFCGFAAPSTPAISAPEHQHHHNHSSIQNDDSLKTASVHDHHSTHGEQTGHKSCGPCCQACGPALTSTALEGELPTPAAPEIHRVERTPPSPIETDIRPPIA